MTPRLFRDILNSLVFFCFTIAMVAQQKNVDSLLKLLETSVHENEKAVLSVQLSKVYERTDIDKGKYFAKMGLSTTNDSVRSEAQNQLGRVYFYSNHLDSAETYFKNSIQSLQKANLVDKIASIQISLGAVQLRKGNYMEAVNTLISSASYFEEQQDDLNMGKCYSNISSAFGELGNHLKAIEYGQKALQIFIDKELMAYQIITLPNLASHFLKIGDTTAAKNHYLKAEKLALKVKDRFSLARIYNNLGNIYLETDYANAELFLKKALAIRESSKYMDGIGMLYNNLGYLYINKEEYQKSIVFLKKALNHVHGNSKTTIINNLSKAYEKNGNHEIALKYIHQGIDFNDSIRKLENQKAINEISTKYETEKKEKEILGLQNTYLLTDLKRKQNRNWLILTWALLFITLGLGYLFFKNMRRKRIILEQEQKLEHQKIDQLLKDQELIGLDALIEGQEKERQRISEELHDNLGGKLSALKLYFEDLRQIDVKLYKKLKGLLDGSYEDVRNIAYEKNSKIMVDQGLIPAIKMVTNRIKDSKKLNIEVINIDLKQKVDHFIGVQLFRIVQELINNTIKHAQAENITIQLSEDNQHLNIIYEDDGIGFEPTKVTHGLGFSNVESRLQKINGSFTIDSSPGNGTTIIINVPL